jgi:hypothetical protein
MATVQEILDFSYPNPIWAYQPTETTPLRSDMTFQRDSKAWTLGPNGIIQEVNSGVPRIFGKGQGLMVEEQATNLIPRGADTSSYTAKSATVSVPGDQVTPYGTNDAAKVTDPDWMRDGSGSVSLQPNTRYTMSAWVKPDEAASTPGDMSSLNFELFNYQTGDILSNPMSIGKKKAANGWQLVFTQFVTADNGTVNNYQQRFLRNSSGTFFVWGLQVEEGGLTSTIPTYGSTVTRNRDKAYASPNISTEEMSYYADVNTMTFGNGRLGHCKVNARFGKGYSYYTGNTHLRNSGFDRFTRHTVLYGADKNELFLATSPDPSTDPNVTISVQNSNHFLGDDNFIEFKGNNSSQVIYSFRAFPRRMSNAKLKTLVQNTKTEVS